MVVEHALNHLRELLNVCEGLGWRASKVLDLEFDEVGNAAEQGYKLCVLSDLLGTQGFGLCALPIHEVANGEM